jgi:hypothetical protein
VGAGGWVGATVGATVGAGGTVGAAVGVAAGAQAAMPTMNRPTTTNRIGLLRAILLLLPKVGKLSRNCTMIFMEPHCRMSYVACEQHNDIVG